MSRRHALLVGIDRYPGFGPEARLAGAVADARAMADVLVARHRFEPRDVRLLLDAAATRDALVDALEALRRRLRPGDEALVHFSGHGSQILDREGDEGDGLDETFVPTDSGRGEAENRDLVDDEIHRWAAGVLAVTPRLTLVFDCCHSATLHRRGWRVRAVAPDLRPDPPRPAPFPFSEPQRDVEVGPRPLVLAACRDDEHALELPPAVAGAARGAFSHHLVEALRDAALATWRELFDTAAAGLARHCPEQHPQLSGDRLDLPLFGSADAPDPRQGGRHLLALAARPDPYGLDLDLYRSRGGAWRPLGEEGFREGDRLRVVLRHAHERELYVYLLDVGLTGRVTLLFPDPNGHEALDPGLSLDVGARRGDELDLHLPPDLPSGRRSGTGHLLLLASPQRISASRLHAGRLEDGSVAVLVRPYRLRRA